MIINNKLEKKRAVAQAATRWLPTSAARIRDRDKLCVGSVVARAALGQVFPVYFGFPCYSSVHINALQSSPSTIHGWYNRPINGSSNDGLGFTSAKKSSTYKAIKMFFKEDESRDFMSFISDDVRKLRQHRTPNRKSE
jgi:hypothetical protein